MLDYITSFMITFVAMISAGYHMDEQFILPANMSSKHVMRLKKEFLKLFVLKNKKVRNSFLKAAIVQQSIAYFALITNIVFALIVQEENYLLVKKLNLYFTGIDILGIIFTGLFYKIKGRLEKR